MQKKQNKVNLAKCLPGDAELRTSDRILDIYIHVSLSLSASVTRKVCSQAHWKVLIRNAANWNRSDRDSRAFYTERRGIIAEIEGSVECLAAIVASYSSEEFLVFEKVYLFS